MHARRTLFELVAVSFVALGACGGRVGSDGGSAGASASANVSASAGASAPASAAASSGGRVACPHALTVWPALRGDELRFAAERGKAFERQTGVAVEIVDVPFDELRQRFVQASEAGKGPDVLYGPNDWGGALAEAGLIADLGGRFDAKKYFDLTAKAASYRGKAIGVPESFEVVTQYYNAALLPGGLSRFDAEAAGAARVPAGQHVVAYDAASFYFSVAFLHAVGGRLFDDEGNFILDERAAARWLALLKKVKRAGGMPKDGKGATAKSLFLEGKVGAYFSGPWDLADIKRGRADWQLAKLPAVDRGEAKPFLGVKLLYVASKSDCVEAAVAFAESLAGLESELAWVKTTNAAHLPALLATYRDVSLRENVAAQGFLAQAESSLPFPNVAAMGQVWGPADEALKAVLEGGSPPAAAAKKMVATIRAALRAAKP
jgi:arabinogalactan oligomer / maltooligosaccharide transport system substrate-binding protein